MDDPIVSPRDSLSFVVVYIPFVGQRNTDLAVVVVDVAVLSVQIFFGILFC